MGPPWLLYALWAVAILALAAVIVTRVCRATSASAEEGFSSATENAAGLVDAADEDSSRDDLDRYSCNLHAARDGGATCSVSFEETEKSEGQDVKCEPIREALKRDRGSYVLAHRFLLDEGRLRTSEVSQRSCDFLPTDTILYPGGSAEPVCSADNPNLYNAESHAPGVVSIEEDREMGRCRLTFPEAASAADLVNYSAFLDVRARVADVEANKGNLLDLSEMRGQ